MAKRYRRKPVADRKPISARKSFPWKKALLLLGLTAVFFTCYQVAISFYWGWVLHAYCIASGLLALAYVLWNRGLFTIPSPDVLPNDWSEIKKETFIKEQERRKKQSSLLLYILTPLIVSVLFDMIYLFLELNMGLKLL